MSNNITLNEVFTPSIPANHNYVVRKSINDNFDRAFYTRGKQIVVYGYTGSGKTTIVDKKMSDYKVRVIKTNCHIDMSIEEVIFNGFHQLGTFYTDNVENSKASKTSSNVSVSLQTKWININRSWAQEHQHGTKEQQKRFVNIQLTPNVLGELMGEAGCCWILEDFHKVKTDDKQKLAQIMKIFMDLAVKYNDLKIIAIGAVNTAREIVSYENEMANRIAEIQVPLMDKNHLMKIIDKGEELLNVDFPISIKNKIIDLSCGLPSVTHSLCNNSCICAGIKPNAHRISAQSKITINKSNFNQAMKYYIEDSRDSFQSTFDKATYLRQTRKHESPKELLYTMVSFDHEEVTLSEFVSVLKEKFNGYKSNNLKLHLDELTMPIRGEVLKFHKQSNTYHFSSPFFKAFVLIKKQEEDDHIVCNPKVVTKKMTELVEDFKLGKQQFLNDFEDFEDYEDYQDLQSDDV